MNEKSLAQFLRDAADRIDIGDWNDDAHLGLIAAARRSSPIELEGKTLRDASGPKVLTRSRWNELSHRDRNAFFQAGGTLVDDPEGGKK